MNNLAQKASADDTRILEQLGGMRSPFEIRRVRWAVLASLSPFVLTLLVDGVAALRLGAPPPGQRYILAGLYDPVYQTFGLTVAVTALLLVAFFQFVPVAFIRLAGQKVMAEKGETGAEDFAATYERWLETPYRFVLGAAWGLLALVVAYFVIFGQDFARLLPGREPAEIGPYATAVWLTNWINTLGFVFALFVGGSLFFRLFATAALINRTPRYFEFEIHPAHPDRCGGFKSVGDLCLKMVYVVLVPTLFFSFWLIISKHVTLSDNTRALLPPYLLEAGFRTPAKILLGVLVATGLAVFFWPMYSLHELMLKERGELQGTLDSITLRIHEIDRGVRAGLGTMSVEDRKKALGEIESLNELYDLTSKTPTWPFERTVALKLVSTQALPFISLLGLGGPLGRLAEFVVGML